MKIPLTHHHQGYQIRLASKSDIDNYYTNNFPLHPSVIKMTGSRSSFCYDEIAQFFLTYLDDPTHFLFVICDPAGTIIGESVINCVDIANKKANFRIALFHPHHKGRGLGSWVIHHTCHYAFEILKLNRLELSVFEFNQIAKACYQKAGFVIEGVLRQAFWLVDEGRFADEILMSLLAHEWHTLTQQH